MEKFYKKILALLLVVCLCLTVCLAGCKKNQIEEPETQPPVADLFRDLHHTKQHYSIFRKYWQDCHGINDRHWQGSYPS